MLGTPSVQFGRNNRYNGNRENKRIQSCSNFKLNSSTQQLGHRPSHLFSSHNLKSESNRVLWGSSDWIHDPNFSDTSSKTSSLTSVTSQASNSNNQGSKKKKQLQIMDRDWESVQKRTFTKWVNNQLASCNFPEVEDLYKGFSDGTALLHLLHAISSMDLGKYNRLPKHRIQKIENLNQALDFISSRGVSLTNIGAEDIVDANPKLILGLIWTIVLRFTISEISEEGLGAKEGLLLWCQRKTANYRYVNVQDFTYSWQDGLAFCALIHRHYPELINFDELNPNNPYENISLAFDIAEEYLNIPKLLEVGDLCDTNRPDERSVMTYVAQYFHAFSELDRIGTAGRRVVKFVEVMQTGWDSQHDYEDRVKELMSAMKNIQSTWEKAEFDGSYQDAKRQASEFATYKSGTKRQWISEKHELDTLLGNIQIKQKTYNIRVYSPPPGLTLSDLDASWALLLRAESVRRSTINRKLRDIKDQLKLKFAKLANAFADSLHDITSALSAIRGDLEEDLPKVQSLMNKLNRLEDDLDPIIDADEKCQEANLEENDYTSYSLDDLKFDMDLTRLQLTKRLTFIDNQLVIRSTTNLNPALLEEFESSFRHFDTDMSNELSYDEFKACLAGLGSVFPDDEFEEIFLHASEGQEEVSFQQFINFMISITEDKTSPDQLREAFAVVAVDKPYVTELDLKVSKLPSTVVKYLIQTMPQIDYISPEDKKEIDEAQAGKAMDYQKFLNEIFEE